MTLLESLEVKFRPTRDDKATARVHISADAMMALTGTLDNGKTCLIESSDPDVPTREAILLLDRNLAKLTPGKPSPAKISNQFRTACSFRFDTVYHISLASGPIADATEVVLSLQDPSLSSSLEGKEAWWTVSLQQRLAELSEPIFPGMVLKDVMRHIKCSKIDFVVQTVNGRHNNIARFEPDQTSTVLRPAAATSGDAGRIPSLPRPSLQVAEVPGMDTPVRELNEFFLPFNEMTCFPWETMPCALVIHGDHGTGKTMLLDRVARTGWGSVHRIKFWDKLAAIRDTFEKARQEKPSVIILDEFERLISKDRSNRDAIIQALCEELDKLTAHGMDKAKDELPQVAVLVSCLNYQSDIPADLQLAGRLDDSMFLPLQDVDSRKTILTSFDLKLQPELKAQTIAQWSQRTHAYNGHDLRKLVGKVHKLVNISHKQADCKSEDGHDCWISDDDFRHALTLVPPTAMRDVNLKPPPTRWDDICGQEEVKQSLRLAVRLLDMKPEVLWRYGLGSPKGVLLYGPPGCSKTMVARAMATESGLNFFAVKGAELLNQYVGESERAVRNLFARARGAAPAMIFFDEIDALAGKRAGFDGGSAGGGVSTSHGALNVLTTLLIEMDGFEATKDVLVLAATNRPQALDLALLRPGRFDHLIYVPPPDGPAREAMFSAHIERGGCAADVDAAALAEMAEGYSGAEVDGICRTAGKAAIGRSLRENDVGDSMVTSKDFVDAMQRKPSMITPEMLKAYHDWQRSFKC